MEQVETTISEHIYNQGKIEGRAEGHAEGFRVQLAVLESLCRQGILSEAQLTAVTVRLRQKLNDLKGMTY
jgi:hypothetical protein